MYIYCIAVDCAMHNIAYAELPLIRIRLLNTSASFVSVTSLVSNNMHSFEIAPPQVAQPKLVFVLGLDEYIHAETN